MVLLRNVKLNQRVLVLHRDRVIPGTVRYTGHLNLESGEWVGVELDYPFGKHNGTWRGWHYFTCSDKCGLFTHASKIKFHTPVRKSFDKYRKVSDSTEVDETLFYTEKPLPKHPYEPSAVNWNYIRRARTAFIDPPYGYSFGVEKRFPLSHKVGNSIPASTMLNPHTAIKPFQYISEPVHREYASGWNNFNPTSSIPHYTMPHEGQLRHRRRGGAWEEHGLKPPRFSTV